MTDVIRVLIADDQVLFAETLSYVLSHISSRIQIAGIAGDGLEAVHLTTQKDVDLILMDVRMPRMDGVQATRLIRERAPSIRIVMLTTFDDDEYVHAAIKYGAVGYLLKSIRPNDLVQAIETAMSGTTLLAPEIGNRLGETESEPEELQRLVDSLSKRELEVLSLMMEMLDNHEIAERLHLSEQRIRNYSSDVYAALGVRGRLELIKLLQQSWGELSK